MFLERQTESLEKRVSLFVGPGCSNESDLHSEDLADLVDIDLREDDLLLDTESVVTLLILSP